MDAVIDYYNGFRDRLVGDYEHGNRRVEMALEFACEELAGVTSVLDVGCGIGWTSAALAAEGKQVTGLDISPVLIETARDRFGASCRFLEGDFLCTDAGTFDVVLMVDVYEHFPRERRSEVHRRIRDTDAVRIVLTVPTPQALRYAREHGIALQPVDEDVTDDDVHRLADDVGGNVHVNRLVTVWRTDDYRHVLVSR